jgi:hypothetical protein
MNKNSLVSKKTQAIIFFGGESLQMLLVYTFAIGMLWLNTPYHNGWKGIFTMIIILNFYNIAKHFIWLRYVLWKQENTNNYN